MAIGDVAELVQQFLLPLGKVYRCFHHDAAQQISRRPAAHWRNPLVAQAEQLASLGFRRDLEFHAPIQRRDFKLATQRRIDEAAKYAPLSQLALSPQCGFSSTVHGNNIAVEDQRNKLRLVVETAKEVWGDS